MIKAFAEVSVIYAAIISPTGESRKLLKPYISGQVQLSVSTMSWKKSNATSRIKLLIKLGK